MSSAPAGSVVGDQGWWTVYAHAGDEKRRDLAQSFRATTGLASTPDPSVTPDAAGPGLIYDTVDGWHVTALPSDGLPLLASLSQAAVPLRPLVN